MGNKTSILIRELSSNPIILKSKEESYEFEGLFAEFDATNENGRIYTKGDYLPHLDYLQEDIQSNSLLGELDHPEEEFAVSMKNVSHMITKLWYVAEKNAVYGRIKILDTEQGRNVKAMVDEGVQLHISSRASGTIDNKGKVNLDTIYTYDIVHKPGFKKARLDRIGLSDMVPEAQNLMKLHESLIIETHTKTEKENQEPKTPVMENNNIEILKRLEQLESSLSKLEATNKVLLAASFTPISEGEVVKKRTEHGLINENAKTVALIINNKPVAIKESLTINNGQLHIIDGACIFENAQGEFFTNNRTNKVDEKKSDARYSALHKKINEGDRSINTIVEFGDELVEELTRIKKIHLSETKKNAKFRKLVTETVDELVDFANTATAHVDELTDTVNTIVEFGDEVADTMNVVIDHGDEVADTINTIVEFGDEVADTLDTVIDHGDEVADTINTIVEFGDEVADTLDTVIEFGDDVTDHMNTIIESIDGDVVPVISSIEKGTNLGFLKENKSKKRNTTLSLNESVDQILKRNQPSRKTTSKSDSPVALNSRQQKLLEGLSEPAKARFLGSIKEGQSVREVDNALNEAAKSSGTFEDAIPKNMLSFWNNLPVEKRNKLISLAEKKDLRSPNQIREFLRGAMASTRNLITEKNHPGKLDLGTDNMVESGNLPYSASDAAAMFS